jgi:hypothetical protein
MRRLALLVMSVIVAAALSASVALAVGGNGSRAKPYGLHTLVTLPEGKGWKLRVNKSVPNGTQLVLHANQFNDPPKPGHQFFIINVTLVYTGKGSQDVFSAGSLNAVGKSNVSYEPGSDDCGVVPGELDEFKKVFSGGQLSGNICFSVKNTDASSLLLYYEPLFSLKDTQVFFRVR